MRWYTWTETNKLFCWHVQHGCGLSFIVSEYKDISLFLKKEKCGTKVNIICTFTKNKMLLLTSERCRHTLLACGFSFISLVHMKESIFSESQPAVKCDPYVAKQSLSRVEVWTTHLHCSKLHRPVQHVMRCFVSRCAAVQQKWRLCSIKHNVENLAIAIWSHCNRYRTLLEPALERVLTPGDSLLDQSS